MKVSSGQLGMVAALGVAQTLAWGSSYYLPAVLADPIATALGTTSGIVFAAFSLALFATAFLLPWVGRCVDLYGGRNVLVTSNAVLALGLALLGTAHGPGMLFASWLVIGLGMSLGLYETVFSTLTHQFGGRARSAITGVALIAGFASTICWPISAWLSGEYGWRTVCFVWASAHLAIALPLNWSFVPYRTGLPPSHCEDRPRRLQGTSASHKGTMYLLAFVFATTWFCSTALASHLPRLLQDAGATPEAAIAAAGLIGPAQVAGRLVDYTVLRRFHALVSARLATLAHPMGVLLFLTLGTPAAVALAGLHGAGNGVLTIAKGTLPLALFGAKGYGQRQGVLMVPARLAQAGAPFLFSVSIERLGLASLLVTAALGVGAFLSLSAINRSLKARTS